MSIRKCVHDTKTKEKNMICEFGDWRDSPEDCGWIHENDVPSIEETSDFLTGLLESVYESGDMSKMEHCLEELCHLYGVEFTPKQKKIQKKTNDQTKWYLGYQQAMIDLANKEKTYV